MSKNFQNHASMFGALASETRLTILHTLQQGEMKAGDIATAVNVSMPLVSQHLSTLRDAGFVTSRREGHFVHYAINEEAKETISLAFAFADKAIANKIATLQALVG